MKKWMKLLGIISGLILALAACSTGEQTTDLTAKDDEQAVGEKVNQIQDEAAKETFNEELTLKVLKNANVVKGYVHEDDDLIAATLVLKQEVNNEDETTLMKQFADEIAELYPNKKVNVIVIREEPQQE